VAASIPFAEELLTAYYCAFDRNTPTSVKATLLGALAYFVLPIDAIPDFLPVLGFTDDAAFLAAAIKLVTDHIRPEHRDAAQRVLADLKKGRPHKSRSQDHFSHHLPRREGLERCRPIRQRIDGVNVRRQFSVRARC